MAEALGGELVTRDNGCFCLIRRLYPIGYRHGSFQLRTPDNFDINLAAFTVEDRPEQLPCSSLLFFDTETTGLHGAGVVPFLIGTGGMTDAGFEVRQYIIPDYSDEAAMLEAVYEEFGLDTNIVSYNGAAFDLPLLTDRMIVNRVTRKIETGHHVDLLHPVRRLFKRRLKECSLTNIERKLFDFHRQDDVPGYLVPSIYFDWLGDENLDQMPSVLEHNRLDILSLYFLVQHIDQVHRSQGETLHSSDDLHSLSRLYYRRKQSDLTAALFDRINETDSNKSADDVLLFHSMNLKRLGQFDRAVEIWLDLSDRKSREANLANIELAKFYEHKMKNIPQALKFAQKAGKTVPPSNSQKVLLDKRLQRLRRKLKRLKEID